MSNPLLSAGMATALVTALGAVPALAVARLDVATAKAIVAKAGAASLPWDGPTTGPKALPGKKVILVSEDQRNGGALGVSEAVTKAARVIGWDLRILDGAGSIGSRSAAFAQAIALRPDVIIADNDDAIEQKANLRKAVAAGIVVIGWHSTIRPGHSPELPLFTDISTDPQNVARVSAALAVALSNGHAGVVVFTDSTEKISVLKSDAMAANIRQCPGCTVLTTIDTPLADVASRVPQMTSSLLQRYGAKWTYSLAINDGFFDFMAPSLKAARIKGTVAPHNIAGGDGSLAAFQRIRAGAYQIATVAEPLHLHGWQAIDEANRALSKQAPSGYVAPTHLVTKADIASDGGSDNVYDPSNGYRDAYRKIWASRAPPGGQETSGQDMGMIDFFWTTPNGLKVLICLEETGLPYRLCPVNIGKGEQFEPGLAISPNNKIPAIRDRAPADGGEPIDVFESGAILLYLARKCGRLLPSDQRGRIAADEWLFWQVGGLGPMAGQNHHFAHYAPEKIPYAIQRYVTETARLYGVLDHRLEGRDFILGEYSVADIAACPWIIDHGRQSQDLDDFPNVRRWFDAVSARPAVQRARLRADTINTAPNVNENSRAILFGQGAGRSGRHAS